MTLADWLRIGEFVIVVLTSIVVVARWSQKVERPGRNGANGAGTVLIAQEIVRLVERIKGIESRLVARDLETRETYVTIAECRARHRSE